jgi:hypothetical protein
VFFSPSVISYNILLISNLRVIESGLEKVILMRGPAFSYGELKWVFQSIARAGLAGSRLPIFKPVSCIHVSMYPVSWLLSQVSGIRVQNKMFSLKCRVQGAGCRVQGAGCRVQGAGFKVQGAGCKVQGARCRENRVFAKKTVQLACTIIHLRPVSRVGEQTAGV